MHEEVQQWELQPKFTAKPIVSILLGALTGVAFGNLVDNPIFGVVLGLMAGGATALALSRISRGKRDSAGGKLRLWALMPLLGFVTLTVLLWAYRFVYL